MNLSRRFVDPCSYGNYSLSCVPGTVLSLLTPEHPSRILPQEALKGLHRAYDKVVLFLVDGLGWKDFGELAAGNGLFDSGVESSVLLRLATQFPSTTACNVTTVNTGLPVAQHGLYEWFYYEPEADDMIAPLLYSYAREQKVRDTLRRDGSLQPASIYPTENLYRKLGACGVRAHAFQSKDYARSTYSDIILGGAAVHGYEHLAAGLAALAKAVLDEPGKAYYYFYYDGLDSLLHRYGPQSPQVKAGIKTFGDCFRTAFWDRISDEKGSNMANTAFILTADHGQTNIDPSRTVYLNREFPELEGWLRRNRRGRIMAPAGSCRDMFLYVKPECLDSAYALLTEKLSGKAVVCRTEELIARGYFGAGPVSDTLKGRLGNLVILALPGESVWWYEQGVFEVDFLGHHGGLTPDEMEIPFLMWTL